MQKVILIIAFLTFAAASHAQKIRVVENSRLAKMLARVNGEQWYAITFGKTIFVSCKKEDFYSEQWWVNHEVAHVEQYRKHGVFRFLSMYLFYSVFHRKSQNPFEREAENAEGSVPTVVITGKNLEVQAPEPTSGTR